MNTRLFLKYDGSRYFGFQRQTDQASIQGSIETALSKIFKQDVKIYGCSRTDARVHALAYYCNFKCDYTMPVERLHIALNCHLPDDIRVFNASTVDEYFHSRFSAKSKTYIYKVWNSEIANPFLANYAYHYPYKLDFNAIETAMSVFLGQHDFTAFMATGGNQKTTVRTINQLKCKNNNELLEFEINANAYLYNMVRIIIGTLLYVGRGKIDPSCISEIIESKDRTKAGITTPAQGLYLKEIYY